MRTFKHPLFWIIIIVSIVVTLISYFESLESIERDRTRQMEISLKLQQYGITNAIEMIVNKAKKWLIE